MKIDAQLRSARTQDMEACARILNDWIDEADWMPRVHSHADVVKYYKSVVASDRKSFVVVSGSSTLGFMVLGPDHLVSALYVDRNYRRQGVGQLLLNCAKREFDDKVHLWTFQKNAAALRFFQREGFREINRTDGDNEEGLPDILLEWQA
jgi:GNAT superfamily N-acetyltransferase